MLYIKEDILKEAIDKTLNGDLKWEKLPGPEMFMASNEQYEISIGRQKYIFSEDDEIWIGVSLSDGNCKVDAIFEHDDLREIASKLLTEVIKQNELLN